ncbi:MAG: excalibur calcium-binding domain-containing protein [Propionicimonas sp.]
MKVNLTAAAVAVALVAALGSSSPAAGVPLATPALNPVATAPAPLQATALASKVKIKKFKNCTALNKTYKHGVGRSNAKDKVSGRSKPVRNFYKNTALYNANKKMDRDKDGIACEKR